MCIIKILLLTSLLALAACKSKPTQPVKIIVNKNHQAITIIGIDYAAVAQIRSDTNGTLWQSLVPVYKMPADTDMKDYLAAQPGKYKVNGTLVMFSPDTPFLKNQAYFLRYYQYNTGVNVLDAARSGQKLGTVPYIDLIFKY